MNRHTAIRILTDFNKWRRGQLKDIPEDNYTVGQAIDYAIEQLILNPTKNRKLKRYEKAKPRQNV